MRANTLLFFSVQDSIQFSTCIVILPEHNVETVSMPRSTVYPSIPMKYIIRKKRTSSSKHLLNSPLAQIPISSSFGNEIPGARLYILGLTNTRYGHGYFAQENKTGMGD